MKKRLLSFLAAVFLMMTVSIPAAPPVFAAGSEIAALTECGEKTQESSTCIPEEAQTEQDSSASSGMEEEFSAGLSENTSEDADPVIHQDSSIRGGADPEYGSITEPEKEDSESLPAESISEPAESSSEPTESISEPTETSMDTGLPEIAEEENSLTDQTAEDPDKETGSDEEDSTSDSREDVPEESAGGSGNAEKETVIQKDRMERDSSEAHRAGITEKSSSVQEAIDLSTSAEVITELSAAGYVYNGSEKKPSVSVSCRGTKLKENTDYTVSYSDNIKAGTASVLIRGAGNYKGTLKKTFTIKRKSLTASGIHIKLEAKSFEWTGKAVKPGVSVTHGSRSLKKGTDYEVSYSKNINAGKAKIIIQGIGNYRGKVKKTFKIKPYVDPDFSLRGGLEFTAVDRNGIKIRSYYDSSDKIYYIFLTKDTDLQTLTLHYTGAELVRSSKGKTDKVRHRITKPVTAANQTFYVREKKGRLYKVKVCQSDLPNVCITLNGTTLEKVNAGTKDLKHPGNSIIITKTSGKVDVSAEKSVELKGRGNTTWEASDKKPYQIKFDEKTDVLGMGKAKKWVLLANSFDDTLMKNKIVFDAANKMSGWWASSFAFCDLWIDGEYLGNYILGEKIEIGSSRLDLQDKNGILVEMDDAFWYREAEEDQIDTTYWGRHFVVSDLVEEENRESAIKCFKNGMKKLEKFLNTADRDTTSLKEIGRYIDVEDAAMYYIFNEFFDNRESFGTSFYFYRDGYEDTIHVGPIWDFDSALGSSDYNAGPLAEGYRNSPFYELMDFRSFRRYTEQMYEKHSSSILKITPKKTAVLKKKIKNSASMNYSLWDFLGKPNGKGSLYDLENTFDAAVARLTGWLKGRSKYFDPGQTMESPSLYAYVNGSELTLNIQNLLSHGYTSAEAHIWSDAGGEDDRTVYEMHLIGDNSYGVSVNLSLHGDVGKYHIQVYAAEENGEKQYITGTSVKLETAAKPVVKAVKGLDGKIYLTISRAAGISSLKAEVRGETQGEDEGKSCSMKQAGTGVFTAVIPKTALNGTGKYSLRIYGYNGGSDRVLIGSKTIMIDAVSVKLPKTKYKYTGRVVTPKPTVTYAGKKLKKGRDYTVEYRKNINAGTASVIITGKGSFGGRVVKTFKIKK